MRGPCRGLRAVVIGGLSRSCHRSAGSGRSWFVRAARPGSSAPPMVAQWPGSSTRRGRSGRPPLVAAVAICAATFGVPVRMAAHQVAEGTRGGLSGQRHGRGHRAGRPSAFTWPCPPPAGLPRRGLACGEALDRLRRAPPQVSARWGAAEPSPQPGGAPPDPAEITRGPPRRPRQPPEPPLTITDPTDTDNDTNSTSTTTQTTHLHGHTSNINKPPT